MTSGHGPGYWKAISDVVAVGSQQRLQAAPYRPERLTLADPPTASQRSATCEGRISCAEIGASKLSGRTTLLLAADPGDALLNAARLYDPDVRPWLGRRQNTG